MNKIPSPLVSIIMNCYNGEKYLREALNSVLAQTYQNWEVIFWDNQSTDKSAEIIKNYDDDRLKYFYAPKHTMLYEARNYAIEKASGEFYAFLDVDDWWIPEKLEKQLPLFADLEVGMVYGNYWYVNENKGTIKTLYKSLPTGMILNELLEKYVAGLLTLVIRRHSFESLDYPFEPQYQIIGDFDMVVRLAVNCKIDCVQSPIASYRLHGANESLLQKERHLVEMENWISQMDGNDSISTQKGFKNIRESYQYMKAMSWIEKNNINETLKIFWKMPLSKGKLKLLVTLLLPSFLLESLKS
jgi:glycosyltransferase involved in cell wall biosynthesis